MSQQALADRFGIGQSSVSAIVRGTVDFAAPARRRRELRDLGMRRCSDCEQEKPLAEFPRNRAQPSGYGAQCKPCNRIRCRASAVQRGPEYTREQGRKWCAANREASRHNARKASSSRRARLRDAFVEVVDPQVVFERDEGVCGICHGPVDRDEFDIDHVEPLALGGEHSYENVRVAHVSCNRRRGRRVALEVEAQRR